MEYPFLAGPYRSLHLFLADLHLFVTGFLFLSVGFHFDTHLFSAGFHFFQTRIHLGHRELLNLFHFRSMAIQLSNAVFIQIQLIQSIPLLTPVSRFHCPDMGVGFIIGFIELLTIVTYRLRARIV
jgi:hypothetical protein